MASGIQVKLMAWPSCWYIHDSRHRYDMLHNSHLGLRGMEELHDWAKFFADCIVPQEYGVDKVR